MADTINRIDIDINTWVLQVVRLAENTSENQAVMELLENKMITKQQRNYIDEWFDNFAQVFVAVSDIHMIDGDGQIRYSYVPYEGYVDKERLKACTQEAASKMKVRGCRLPFVPVASWISLKMFSSAR